MTPPPLTTDEVLQLVGSSAASLAQSMTAKVASMEASDVWLTNYVGLIGFTILLWDHIISFPDEVRLIWLQKKSIFTRLFLLNRYFVPLSFIGNLCAYFLPWSPECAFSLPQAMAIASLLIANYTSCKHFVRYEGSCTVIALQLSSLLLFMRVRAMYIMRPAIVYSVGGLWIVETAVQAWLLSHGIPVPHQTMDIRSCTMIFDHSVKGVDSLSAWLPLIYDTLVIGLTLNHFCTQEKNKAVGHITRVLMRDGLLYYSVLFCVNFALAIMIVASPAPVQNIAAQLEELLTVAMISRITLNLKKQAYFVPNDIDTMRSSISSLQCERHGACRNSRLHVEIHNNGETHRHFDDDDEDSSSYYTGTDNLSRPASRQSSKASHEPCAASNSSDLEHTAYGPGQLSLVTSLAPDRLRPLPSPIELPRPLRVYSSYVPDDLEMARM